ncbi:hypothetical protein IEQ34_022240 [Dendrobium chrysotoxum]|uniref:ABC transporter C family member 10 n=1 Tax=Dendrobium chrysotoxum TaxID=161865 RepID=A0AAV7FK18_DENCH|nr:hypothetical protein IEQ34_022240 [Dendrobium chrysotoxum]
MENDKDWSKIEAKVVSDGSLHLKLDGNPSKLDDNDDNFKNGAKNKLSDAEENGGKVVNRSRKSKNLTFATDSNRFIDYASMMLLMYQNQLILKWSSYPKKLMREKQFTPRFPKSHTVVEDSPATPSSHVSLHVQTHILEDNIPARKEKSGEFSKQKSTSTDTFHTRRPASSVEADIMGTSSLHCHSLPKQESLTASSKNCTFKEDDRVKYIGMMHSSGLPFPAQRGPHYSFHTKVILTFKENGSSKIGVRFDKQIVEGNDLGGLCEEDHGFFYTVDLLHLDYSSPDNFERIAINEFIGVMVEEVEKKGQGNWQINNARISLQLMSDGEFISAASFHELLASSKEFQELVNAHKNTVGAETLDQLDSDKRNKTSIIEINNNDDGVKKPKTESTIGLDQLIKKEEIESGNTGMKPYLQYLSQNKGFLFTSLAALSHAIFMAGQISQNSWMAAKVQNPEVSMLKLISVYLAIGFGTVFFLLSRSIFVVALGMESSRSLFSQLLNSLFRAPMSFFDSTPLGRILSRVSSDLSIVDLDVPFAFIFSISATVNAYSNIGVLSGVVWQILFVAVPLIYLTILLQRYYLASAKELMRINGTTKSLVANHLAESVSGVVTIRAFEEEDRFFAKSLVLIDKNASPYFHNFAASEWLIQRLETMSAVILSSSALVMAMLPPGTFSPGKLSIVTFSFLSALDHYAVKLYLGFVGLALSYGLSLNMSLVFSIQNQCTLANYIISVERLNQYMHVASEAPEVIENNRPAPNWPAIGRVELQDLQIRYRPDTPLVIRGISCIFEGGDKIGIVGRTGSGKTTLIGALFRLVEPAGGRIIIDGIDIAKIGLHDLRSRFGIIPQDPTLFHGSVRYNLDPLAAYTDQQIWEVLEKCQLREAVLEKGSGLDSLVVEDGSNWSMGQRQLFCLGRALLKKSRILVLDEATASIDNATDAILQKTIRTEFADSTVITVAHRIPTVMDCTMVLVVGDGKLIEYDEPLKLMNTEGSLFRELVNEYWSHTANTNM